MSRRVATRMAIGDWMASHPMVHDATARWAPRLLALAVVAAIASAATSWIDQSRPAVTASVPLTEGIRSGATTPDDDIAFNSRVQALIPLGMPDRQMGRLLFDQGFRRADWSASTADEHSAVRREDDGECDRGYYIYWHVNTAAEVSAIRGEYSAACR